MRRLILQIITFIFFIICYHGVDGFNASIQTNFSFQLFNFPIHLNHLQIYFLVVVFQLLGLFFAVGVTLLVSSLSKASFTSVIISIGLYFLPLGLIQIFQSGLIHQGLNLFPINLYDPYKMFVEMSSSTESLFSSFLNNYVLSVGVFIIIGVVLMIITYLKEKNSFD